MGETFEKELRSAEILQRALLPKKRHFDRVFDESFVLYYPKEILSGDFYWIGQKSGIRFIVVGDCSGHGISAALVSVLMLNLFEHVIMNKGIVSPDEILNELDKRYIESFKNTGDGYYDNPWVDLSVIAIDDVRNHMHFASANRKLLHVSGERGIIHKSTGYSLGGWQVRSNRNFGSTKIDFLPGDKIYIGSDGFQDQFGGNMSKKFGSRRLHDLLCSISEKPMELQKERLSDVLMEWKSNETQTDDICIVGVQL